MTLKPNAVFSAPIVHLSYKEPLNIRLNKPQGSLLLFPVHIMCSAHFPVIVLHSDLVISTTNKSNSTWECSLLLFCQWILAAAAGVQRKQATCCLDQLIVPPLRIWDISDLFIYRLALACQHKSKEYVRCYWLRLMMIRGCIICGPYDAQTVGQAWGLGGLHDALQPC